LRTASVRALDRVAMLGHAPVAEKFTGRAVQLILIACPSLAACLVDGVGDLLGRDLTEGTVSAVLTAPESRLGAVVTMTGPQVLRPGESCSLDALRDESGNQVLSVLVDLVDAESFVDGHVT
jgi:hypothetical protein